jgi:hypothetical protein
LPEALSVSELQALTAQHMFLSHLEYDIYTKFIKRLIRNNKTNSMYERHDSIIIPTDLEMFKIELHDRHKMRKEVQKLRHHDRRVSQCGLPQLQFQGIAISSKETQCKQMRSAEKMQILT